MKAAEHARREVVHALRDELRLTAPAEVKRSTAGLGAAVAASLGSAVVMFALCAMWFAHR
ncbi:hypothetical protein D3C72_1995530 [compost metagenome]